MTIEGLEPSNYYYSLLFDQYNLNYSSVAYSTHWSDGIIRYLQIIWRLYHFAHIVLFEILEILKIKWRWGESNPCPKTLIVDIFTLLAYKSTTGFVYQAHHSFPTNV